MAGPKLSRRSLLRGTGAGVLGAIALSTGPASGHESYEASAQDLLGPILVRPRPEQGFNYPYFLYAPAPNGDGKRPILVEPNNTGTATDEYRRHLTRAADLTANGNGRTLSEALTVPLLVPVFPRSRTNPVGGNTYTHALDVDTLEVTSGEAARIDEQLLSMVDHAAELLSGISYPVQGEEILMHGFSASGNFVNRFPAIHPDRVRAVTAGGINGTAVLPITEAKGHTLNYHIGVADLESLVGEPFDLDAFREVEQYVYMGAEDDNDTIPYSDAWGETQRQIALDVYGEDMQADRMPYCESVYDEAGVAATFKIYDGVGHRTTPEMMADLVEFHRRNVGLSSVSFTSPPGDGTTSVALDVTVAPDAGDSFDIRVFDDAGGDLTATPASVSGGESTDTHVTLTRDLTTAETVTAAVLLAGETNREAAIADATATVVESVQAGIVGTPTDGEASLTVEYAIDGEYETGSPLHVYVTVGDGDQTLVDTIDPGSAGTATYDLESGGDNVPFVAGETVTVRFTDIDADEDVAGDTATVAETDGLRTPATVSFGSHPTYDDTELSVEYSLDAAYEVDGFVGLYFRTAENPPLLLDRIQPGENTTAAYPIDKYPFEAADEAVLSVTDGKTLARESALVLVREPEEDDNSAGEPTATFEYSPDAPTAGESVSFDATNAGSPNGELLGYEWFFGEDATGAGETVSYAFEEGGTYTVRLELVDEAGKSTSVERTVTVESDGTAAESAETADPGETTTAGERDDTAGEDGAGFGVLAGLSGLASAGYLLGRT